MDYSIRRERLSPEEYVAFLKRTDLGSQYPKERFEERVAALVASVPISLTARDSAGELPGVCFGITDFAYWLFITDLGVVRTHTGRGHWPGADGPGPGSRGGRRKHHHVHLPQRKRRGFLRKAGHAVHKQPDGLQPGGMDRVYGDVKRRWETSWRRTIWKSPADLSLGQLYIMIKSPGGALSAHHNIL